MKAKSIIGLVITLLVISALVFTAVCGVTIVNPFNGEKYYFPNALDEEYGIKRGLDLVGGSIISFEADMSGVPQTEEPAAEEPVEEATDPAETDEGVAEEVEPNDAEAPADETATETTEEVTTETEEVATETATEAPADTPAGVPSQDDMDAAMAVVRTRLDSQGYYDATVVQRGNKTISIEIPNISDPEEAVQMLGATAKLTFRDPEGNVIMEGGTDVKRATYKYGQTSENGAMEHYVELEFTSEGTRKFSEATTTISANTSGNNYISIYLDEDEISSPRVSEPITMSTCVINGNFTEASASALANQIQSGQLPFALKEAELRSIGPTLGDKALETSLFAAAIGILFVLLFMLIIYRIPGLISCIALMGYISLVVLAISGYFSFLGVNGTLTLPGIAGIVLGVGMAVDANIVIFERIKDELRAGKSARAAVESGFHNALRAIIDSNITTIIAAIVLSIFGTGTIKGFAWTLAIGIIVSMISAVLVTRMLLKIFLNLGLKSPGAFGVKMKKEVQE
ncbi:MAG: protein translocase subunit SecD [Ruminococcaceae bacterium]|nr:protein translocase subunit SecD [Oscillospiraceae bacterium]